MLLLLHPNGFCAGVFHPVAARLAARGACRPIGIDLRGHGATTSLPALPDNYGYDLMAGDVVAVLDALGVGEVVLLGESLGGGVSILVDALAPGRVTRLLLCEPVAMPAVAIGDRPVMDNPMATGARRR